MRKTWEIFEQYFERYFVISTRSAKLVFVGYAAFEKYFEKIFTNISAIFWEIFCDEQACVCRLGSNPSPGLWAITAWITTRSILSIKADTNTNRYLKYTNLITQNTITETHMHTQSLLESPLSVKIKRLLEDMLYNTTWRT